MTERQVFETWYLLIVVNKQIPPGARAIHSQPCPALPSYDIDRTCLAWYLSVLPPTSHHHSSPLRARQCRHLAELAL